MGRLPKPAWLRVPVPGGEGYARLQHLVEDRGLHTVCREALCPNMGRCWAHGRATLMILGDRCTRGCRFCNVGTARPGAPDEAEPERVAEAVEEMGLREVVITSVTRDDLPDGGAAVWARVLQAIRARCPDVLVEVLVPDFGGSAAACRLVLAERPAVWGHNLETVPSLYAEVRPEADYGRSLEVLRLGRAAGLIVKTALMLGLGEELDEVFAVMADARAAGCDVFYAGQYLQPSPAHRDVRRYVTPEEFEEIRRRGLALGFPVVVAAPLVRSSYHDDGQAAFTRERLAKA